MVYRDVLENRTGKPYEKTHVPFVIQNRACIQRSIKSKLIEKLKSFRVSRYRVLLYNVVEKSELLIVLSATSNSLTLCSESIDMQNIDKFNKFNRKRCQTCQVTRKFHTYIFLCRFILFIIFVRYVPLLN